MDRILKKKFPRLFYYIIILIIIFSFIVLFTFNANKKSSLEFYTIKFKLIASTHTDLPWEFEPVKPSMQIKIGEVVNIEYLVKNISNEKTYGIATFSYYPRELSSYIIKVECFCYEIQTLNAAEENKYTMTMMIDPEVTKDSKTKGIKEAIIQFTFFDGNNYKENKS